MEVNDVTSTSSSSSAMLELMQIEQAQQSIALNPPVVQMPENNNQHQEEQISILLRNLEAVTTGVGLRIDAKG